MEWAFAISGVKVSALSGRDDIDVRGVQYDSRRVTAGDVFVAMRGGTSDGNKFVDAAIRKGAVAIVTDSEETFDWLKRKQPEFAVALVEHGRRALAEVSSAVFGAPEKQLALCAVTGTNGKTTVAYLLEQLLRAAGRKCVLLGTIETHVGDEVRASEHTTPESRDVLRVFADGVSAGCSEAVMEMSSHALEQERVWGMPVDVAVFTNLTQDHLDYHVTMDRYARAKSRLFEGVGGPQPRVAVINADDAYATFMVEAAKSCRVMTYGMDAGDWRAQDVVLHAGETRFALETNEGKYTVESPLTGRVNVYNVLAAMAAAHARGITTEEIITRVRFLRPAPGRFEVVQGSHEAGITVVVDYAHTDDALRNLCALARDLVSDGRVITLFGCGGDRDRTKRPKMGRAAAELSDVIVVTSDNPRSEDPMTIIDEVLLGVREAGHQAGIDASNVIVEPERHKAIAAAIRAAKSGDIVLLAGKGHEKEQIFADGAMPFDDIEEAARALRERKNEVAV